MGRVPSRLIVEWLFVALLAAAGVLGLRASGITARADNILYDSLLSLSAAPSSEEVVIVAIDEPSLAGIGRWPWPRRVHAALLDRLAAARPRAIAYDVLFVEPSGDDPRLARAMARVPGLLLPIAFTVPGSNGRAFDVQAPTPLLAAAGPVLGQAAVPFDSDAVVRRAALLAGDEREHWPHLAEMLYRHAAGHPSPAWRRLDPRPPRAGRFDLSGSFLVPFGPSGRFTTASFADVLAGRVPEEVFRGKVVLVGSTAAGSGDRYPVPSGRTGVAMPGVEMLANTFAGLAADRVVTPVGADVARLATFLPLLVVLAAFLRLPPRINLIVGAGMIAMLLLASGGLLRFANLWLPPAGSIASLLIVYPLWAWRRLEATSAFMANELVRLAGEPDELPRRAEPRARWALGDRMARQTRLLNGAIERVRDLRHFFADSLRSLPDPTIVVDTEQRLLVANAAARTLFAIGSEDDRPVLDGLLARISETPHEPGSTEHELTARDGRIFILRSVPLSSASEQAGAIVRLTDISAIRLATRQREDALELLTHDMRSPQASILALLETGGDSATLHRRIGGYARRTLDLADEFVQLARAESAPYGNELLDLGMLLVEAADDQWVLAERKHVRIATEDGGEEHLVRGDRSLLGRALVNILNNAVKHSPEGGTIRGTVGIVDDRISLAIADEGPGVPQEQLAYVFERFRTLSRAGRRDVAGAGLGLSFVSTVVERHGGTIACANAPGGGAVFTVMLPRAHD